MSPLPNFQVPFIEHLRARLAVVRSYGALAKDIEKAVAGVGDSGSVPIDRRKLKRLIEGVDRDQVPLKLSELKAISEYLRIYGHSLTEAALFAPPARLSDAMVDSGQVTYLVGSRNLSDEMHIHMSGWDIRAATHSVGALADRGKKVTWELVDVPRSDEQRPAAWTVDPETVEDTAAQPNWLRALGRGRGAVVSIGSSRVSDATEQMMVNMFQHAGEDLREFVEPANPSLPFHFLWNRSPGRAGRSDGQPSFPSSAFSLNSASAQAHFPAACKAMADAGGRRATHAIVYRPSAGAAYEAVVAEYSAPGSDSDSSTFGVVVSQRRGSGGLWVCVAGLTGIATFGCMQALHHIEQRVRRAEEDDEKWPVTWVVIEVMFRRSDDTLGVDQVHGHRVAAGPFHWPSTD